MSSIAIIPARSGSARIPRKNLVSFLGRPLIEWTIDAAKESRCFDRVLVSTDSPEVAEVARAAGADAPFLRLENSDDVSSSTQATVSALNQARDHWGQEFDTVTQLLPTCPLRTPEQIKQMHAVFDDDPRKASLISASKFLFQPVWWAAEVGDAGVHRYLFPASLNKRSQDLRATLAPNGAVWISSVGDLMSTGSFYSPTHKLFEIPWFEGLDIDTPEQLFLVETLGRALSTK